MIHDIEEHAARAACSRAACKINLGETERTLSTLAGAMLIAGGILRGRLVGAASALAGGCLVYRGVTGHCSVYEALGISTAETPGS
jgi:uncharacterized membrane protein